MSEPVDYKTLNTRYKKPELIKLYLKLISELQTKNEIIKDLKSKVNELEENLTKYKQDMVTNKKNELWNCNNTLITRKHKAMRIHRHPTAMKMRQCQVLGLKSILPDQDLVNWYLTNTLLNLF